MMEYEKVNIMVERSQEIISPENAIQAENEGVVGSIERVAGKGVNVTNIGLAGALATVSKGSRICKGQKWSKKHRKQMKALMDTLDSIAVEQFREYRIRR